MHRKGRKKVNAISLLTCPMQSLNQSINHSLNQSILQSNQYPHIHTGKKGRKYKEGNIKKRMSIEKTEGGNIKMSKKKKKKQITSESPHTLY